MSNRQNQLGQTLVEVVVAAGIVIMCLSILTAAAVAAVANSRRAKERAVGIRVAQEGLEWLRKQKEVEGWDAFDAKFTNSGTKYCLGSALVDNPAAKFANVSSAGTCSLAAGGVTVRIPYIRYATINRVTPGTVTDVTIRVEWSDGQFTEMLGRFGDRRI